MKSSDECIIDSVLNLVLPFREFGPFAYTFTMNLLRPSVVTQMIALRPRNFAHLIIPSFPKPHQKVLVTQGRVTD